MPILNDDYYFSLDGGSRNHKLRHKAKKGIVWANGTFDILHVGHLELFKFARSLLTFNEGILIVGIDSDRRIKELKGEGRPFNKEKDRKYFLEQIKDVDSVEIFDSKEELERLIDLIQPHFMVVGEEYKGKQVIGSQFADEVRFFPRISGYSSTNILKKGFR